MRITVDDGSGLRVTVSPEVATKALRIQQYVGGLLSDTTMDAIVRDLSVAPYTPQEDLA
jgi:hypothetical protein